MTTDMVLSWIVTVIAGSIAGYAAVTILFQLAEKIADRLTKDRR